MSLLNSSLLTHYSSTYTHKYFSLQTSDPGAFSAVSSYNPQEQAPTSLWWSLGYKPLLFDPLLGQKTSSTSFFQLPNSRSCFCWEQGGNMAFFIIYASFVEIKPVDNVVSILQMHMQTVRSVVHSTAKHELLLRFTTYYYITTINTTALAQNRIILVVSYWFMDSWSTRTLTQPEGLIYDWEFLLASIWLC